MKHWPLVLGLILLLAGLGVYALRRSASPVPEVKPSNPIHPSAGGGGSSTEKPPSPPSGDPSAPSPAPKKPVFGKLKVVVTAGSEPIAAQIVVVGTGDRSEGAAAL